MSDPNHLYEADKVRIRNEAKVRTALEQPDFAQREFGKWQAEHDLHFKRDYDAANAYYWTLRAWVAEGREVAMGRQLNKAQQRIGRLREANRNQHNALREAQERIRALEGALRTIANAGAIQGMNPTSWPGASEGRPLAVIDAQAVARQGLSEPRLEAPEEDEYSDEDIAKWHERDKLDPETAEWLKRTVGKLDADSSGEAPEEDDGN